MVRAHDSRLLATVLPSLGAAALCSLGFRLAGKEFPTTWVLVTALLTLAVYAFYYDWPLPWGIRLAGWQQLSKLMAIGLMLFVAGGMLVGNPEVWALYGISALLPLAYASPGIPALSRWAPRAILRHKPLMLAVSWLWGAFLLPWWSAGFGWNEVPWRSLAPYLVNLVGLCLLFAWRDRTEEVQAGWLKAMFAHAPLGVLLGLLIQGIAISFSPDFPLVAGLQTLVLLLSCALQRFSWPYAYLLADASMLLGWL